MGINPMTTSHFPKYMSYWERVFFKYRLQSYTYDNMYVYFNYLSKQVLKIFVKYCCHNNCLYESVYCTTCKYCNALKILFLI